MTGIMVTVAGGQGLTYATGLYGPSGPDQVPIADQGNSPLTLDRTWIGYYVPATSGNKTISIIASWESSENEGQYSIAYLWTGNKAKSGYNTGNADATANNGSANYTLTGAVAGNYYPIRLQWVANLTEGGVFFPWSTTGSFSLTIAGSSTPALYYNTATNGF
jgi:hypothetical protein